MRKFLLFSLLAFSMLAVASEAKTVDFSPDVGITQVYTTFNDFQFSAGTVSDASEFTILNFYQIFQDWAICPFISTDVEQYWEYVQSGRKYSQVFARLYRAHSINAPPNASAKASFITPDSYNVNFV